MLDLAKAFGHGVGMALVLIFLTPIGYLVLGFGGSQYQLAEGSAVRLRQPRATRNCEGAVLVGRPLLRSYPGSRALAGGGMPHHGCR